MLSIPRLQAYLRHNARKQYEAVSGPPFTLFFHPHNALTFFNYAIPDEAIPDGAIANGAIADGAISDGAYVGDLTNSLAKLRETFLARGRQPRFEFIKEFAPDLAPALRAAGFVEEERQQGMICLPDTFQPAPGVAGLTIARLTRTSPVSEVQDFVTVQGQGFDPDHIQPATESDARQFMVDFHQGVAFLARLNGQSVGAGLYTSPFDGLTEITGLTTLKPFRRRGIATALTALAVQTAFEQGVEAVYLTAAGERSGRVYERVGFRRYATMLAYIEWEAIPEKVEGGKPG